MFDDRIYKIIKDNIVYDYYEQILNKGIIIISPNCEKYINDKETISIKYNESISRKLIIDLLSYDDSFALIKKVLDEKLNLFYVMFIRENGSCITRYTIDKSTLLKILGKIKNIQDPKALNNYNECMKSISYEEFKSRVINDNYHIAIDKKTYDIKVKDIIDFMDKSELELNSILKSTKEYKNIPIHYFIYAVKKYYEENKVFEKYSAEKIKTKLLIIISSSIVDIEAINQYLNSYDPLLDEIKVDKELESEILKDIPNDFNDLEKAIYVYIKMCKLLSYDESVYVSNQDGPFTEIHRKFDNISKISIKNNRLLCFEFNALLSYMLNKLGINYKCFQRNEYPNGIISEDLIKKPVLNYGYGHTLLKFRCGKYIIKADSTTSILRGDLINAKLNQGLEGIVCENDNMESRQEFHSSLEKVYKYIASREKKISQNEVGKKETFEEVVSEFISKTDKRRKIDIREKIDILINKVNSSNLTGIDAYAYLLQLRIILFTQEELDNNVSISIIRSSSESVPQAIAVITTIIPDQDGRKYVNRYMYKPGYGLVQISIEELQELFDNNTVGYINEDSSTIKGIRV